MNGLKEFGLGVILVFDATILVAFRLEIGLENVLHLWGLLVGGSL